MAKPLPVPAPSAMAAARRAKETERARACAAFDAMVAARPKKPPPGQIAVRRATAAELALASDKRHGILGATGPFLDGI